MSMTPQAALDIINKEKKEKTGILQLNGLGLTDWPDELFEMNWLVVLSMGKLFVWDVTNKLFEFKYNSNKSNTLIHIDPRIKKLKNLKALNLDSNQITKIEGIDNLPITHLNLSENQITKIEGLDNLPITHLYLYGNQISKIEGIDNLPITHLNLYENQISKIDGNAAFKKLLDGLIYLRLKGNPFQNMVWIDAESIHGIANDVGAIRERVSQYINDKLISIELPVKMILLGNSEAGKTSLAKHLLPGNEKFQNEEGSTHGLKIRDWKVGENKVFIYDFGGQDYYHGVYTMFFTSQSLYTLVWGRDRNYNEYIIQDRSGGDLIKSNQYINYSTDYWLGNIWYWQKRYALKSGQESTSNSQLHITSLQNLRGDDKVHYLAPHTPDGCAPVDIQLASDLNPTKNTSPININRLQYIDLCLQSFVKDLSTSLKKFTSEDIQAINTIIDEISNTPQYNKMTINAFKKKYRNESNYLYPILHNRGMILHYSTNAQIKDIIWVNPATVSDEIYSTLLKKDSLDDGRVTEKKFVKQVNDDALLALMVQQEIVFLDDKPNHEGEYIIPQYLPHRPDDDPLYDIAISELTEGFYLQMSHYLPHGLMSRLICRFGKNPGKKYYYRYEMIFNLPLASDKQAKVLLNVDMIQLRINVTVALHPKLEKYRAEVYSYLFQAILTAYWDFDHQDYISRKEVASGRKEMEDGEIIKQPIDRENQIWARKDLERYVNFDLQISVDGEYFVDYSAAFKNTKDNSIPIHVKAESLENQSTKMLSTSLFNPFISEKQKVTIPKRLFISYSHKDRLFMERMEIHLKALKREGLISYWTDHMIETGEEWNESILAQMEAADVVVYLLSPDFIVSNYIMDVELPKGIEIYENNKEIDNGMSLYFIQLKPCRWKQTEIQKYQQYVDGDDFIVVQEANNDNAWNNIMADLTTKLKKK